MAWIRQLPSGRWQGTVYTPMGRRTKTHDLRGAVRAWADEQERAVNAGDWIDPKDGKVTVGSWWERCRNARRLEYASRERDDSHWRVHVEPEWSSIPIGAILKPDVSSWIVSMERAGAGAATIQGALGVLRSLLEQAVDARIIRDNPARGVKPPRRQAHLDRVLEPDEDLLLLDACDRLFPGRSDARLLIELMLYCGLRWEEAGALDREHVNLRRAVLSIGPVLERNGNIRPYPKSRAGKRDVPVDDEVWPRVRAHAMTIDPGGLLVTGPEGKTLDYSRWHHRVWSVILAGRPAIRRTRGHAARLAIPGADLDDPRPTPHDLRHTYGTRLGEQGVPAHEIMALMGHSSLQAVQRYLHAGDGRHDRAREAMRRARLA